MFELKHLKTIAALNASGSIRKTAERLFLTQSALSHQLKELESKLGEPIFIRNTSPVQFTPPGRLLLELAHKILPEVETAVSALKGQAGTNTSLTLAFACHACFQWLLPVTQALSKQNPGLRFDFTDPLFAQEQQQADILFTDEINESNQLVLKEIGKFELVAVMANQHPLAQKPFLMPEDFQEVNLLTYPVPPRRLDIFNLFLTPQAVTPNKIKQVANSHMMLQMAAADMGVAVLPDWLVTSLATPTLVKKLSLGKTGLFKTLYASYRPGNNNRLAIEDFLPRAISAFKALYR
ncbi:LysR family transcriptional regulator [Thalassomonas viridans]|uniref:LysR family transcriptional regulator n=1 Tax=Thalassomonas viridans TaxID=137584 RepID=A0AAF0C8Q2_9GAMM|nr:LysR substrate-binding domain-containing protein [Thalassomonas viridans]WDE04621.1 LysR family transcriptional regulator [Thalassomonas viridans]